MTRVFCFGGVVLVAAVLLAACGQESSAPRKLTEEDVLKLIDLKIEATAIVARIEQSGVAFEVDDAALERLREAGAPAAVLTALAGDEPAVRYEAYDGEGGAVSLSGTLNTRFSLLDAEGRVVASSSTGAQQPLQVPAGKYRLFINESYLPLVVKRGQRTIVATGQLCVLSSGGERGDWSWRRPDGHYHVLRECKHDDYIELPAGSWYVKPGGSFYHVVCERRITVRPGRKLTLKTGAIKAIDEDGSLSVYRGKQEITVGQWANGHVVHLFPGQYDVWHLLAVTGKSNAGIPIVENVKIATVDLKAGESREVKSPY